MADIFSNMSRIVTPMFRILIDVLPAIISPMMSSNFLSSCLGSLKNITLPPLFLLNPEP